MTVPELTSVEARVVGSLLEKEVTVPATYPMTLNGLVSACNQTSGRDPVLALTEHEVTTALTSLRAAGLTRNVHASHGARTEKYRQVLHEVLELEPPERAVVTLLLLRGPQTPGELRSRSDRLHTFASLDEVERALDALTGREEPLVSQLAREPGRREARWASLLTADREPEAAVGPQARWVDDGGEVELVIDGDEALLAVGDRTWRLRRS